MPAWARKALVDEVPKPSAGYRYTMLALIIGLLVWHVQWLRSLPPSYPYERYNGFVVPLMLLLNHLVFAFHWPVRTRIALRLAAYVWCIVGFLYVAYFSNVWFPS